MRGLVFTLVLVAVALVAAGGVAWLLDKPSAPEPLLVVGPEAFDLAVSPGEHTLVVRVTNPAAVPRQIVGVASGCGGNCCYSAKQTARVTIPPGGSVEFPLLLTVHAPGPFESVVELYLDDAGIRPVDIPIRGLGLGALHEQK